MPFRALNRRLALVHARGGSVAAEHGVGLVCDLDMRLLPDVAFLTANEEHGFLTGAGARDLRVGDLVRVVPNHACGTVNMWSSVTVVEDVAAADLMVEAVVEDADVKHDVFRRADATLPPEAILASNTSSIPI